MTPRKESVRRITKPSDRASIDAEMFSFAMAARRIIFGKMEKQRTEIRELLAKGRSPADIRDMVASQSLNIQEPISPEQGDQIEAIVQEEFLRMREEPSEA